MTVAARLRRLRRLARERLPATQLFCLFLALILWFEQPRPYRNFFYLAVIPAFLLCVDREVLRRLMRSSVWWLAAAYLLALWLSLLWSPDATAFDFYQHGRRSLLILLFLAITAWLADADAGLERKLFAWLGAAALAAGTAWAWTFYSDPAATATRLSGPGIHNANVAAALFGTVAIGAIGQLLARRTSRRLRLYFAVVALGGGVYLGLTQNRGSLLALAVAVTVAALLAAPRRQATLCALATAVAAALLLLAVLPVEGWIGRGDSYRLALWQRYFEMVMAQPWLGYGVEFDVAFRLPSGKLIVNPHSIYLSSQIAGGLPATLTLLLVIGAALRAALRRPAPARPTLTALLIFLAVNGLFYFPVLVENAAWHWVHLWLPLGLAAGAELTAARGQPRPAG